MIFGLKRLETLILQYIQVKYILSRNQQKIKKILIQKEKEGKPFQALQLIAEHSTGRATSLMVEFDVK